MEEEVKPKGSYLKAIALAFAFGLIGVVAWILIGGFARFISAWIAFFIAVGIRYGYDKANGPQKGRTAIILLMYLLLVFISIYVMYYIIISSVIGISFWDVLSVLALPQLQTSETTTEYVLIGVFSVIGIAFLFYNDFLVKRNKKITSGETKAKQGGRLIVNVPFNGDYEKLSAEIDGLLKQKKYELQNYGEEKFYRNGNGNYAAAKFIRYSSLPDGVLIEAFVLIGNKEHGLEGFVGVIAKKPLKALVEEISEIIRKQSKS